MMSNLHSKWSWSAWKEGGVLMLIWSDEKEEEIREGTYRKIFTSSWNQERNILHWCFLVQIILLFYCEKWCLKRKESSCIQECSAITNYSKSDMLVAVLMREEERIRERRCKLELWKIVGSCLDVVYRLIISKSFASAQFSVKTLNNSK